jgi:hypothetical protein
MIGPDVEPAPLPVRDPLKHLVDGLAVLLGAAAVALALAEHVWQQVKPS